MSRPTFSSTFTLFPSSPRSHIPGNFQQQQQQQPSQDGEDQQPAVFSNQLTISSAPAAARPIITSTKCIISTLGASPSVRLTTTTTTPVQAEAKAEAEARRRRASSAHQATSADAGQFFGSIRCQYGNEDEPPPVRWQMNNFASHFPASSSFDPHWQSRPANETYHYPNRQESSVWAMPPPGTSLNLSQATMDINSNNNHQLGHLDNLHFDNAPSEVAFRKPLSTRLSMPMRSIFARNSAFREDFMRDDFFDELFKRDFGMDIRHPSMELSNRNMSTSGSESNNGFIERQHQVITHPIQRLDTPADDFWGAPRQGLEEKLIHHLIQHEEPDQLEQRVKIFIAQDRARGLARNGNGVIIGQTATNATGTSLSAPNTDNRSPLLSTTSASGLPRISARLPQGGSLSFSFSTASNTLKIDDGNGNETSHVPPHASLTIEQKRQLKQRLLAQKQDLIAGPNTSATFLKSDHTDSPPGSRISTSSEAHYPSTNKSHNGRGSVAERVMLFEGYPELQFAGSPFSPASRLQKSAAHLTLQNWQRNEAQGDRDLNGGVTRPPSVERTIPIIRESDAKPIVASKPTSSAISITLEVPQKQSGRISNVPTSASSDIQLTPSKPGNHYTAPQAPIAYDAAVQAQTKSLSSPEPSERIIPTILPSIAEPKPLDRRLFIDHQAAQFDEDDLSVNKKPAVKSPDFHKASQNIIRALQNDQRREEEKERKKQADACSTPKHIPVPPFYYPRGKPIKAQDEETVIEKVKAAFSEKAELKLDEMQNLMLAFGLPFYWRRPMFLAAVGTQKERETVTFDMVFNVWKNITAHNHDDASRFVALLAKPGSHFLLPSDFVPLVQDVVDTHPGLNILKEAPEFHARYTTTVIARIFYSVNRSWTGRITIEELRRSSFLKVLATLEHEDDINVITEYFSYEHFYVIYCKFWELDRDHDLFVDKDDLSRHNDQAISSRMIDRIFSGAVTRGSTLKEGKMSYTEFVWFLIAEEDKRHPTSIEYWFRCMDLDGDGCLSLYELEYFYEEQLERMKALGIEALPFQDIACQMLDMVHPCQKDKIRLKDLKRCKMTPLFFDTFFNIEKYLLHEHRDPFASTKVDSDECKAASDWDRYAAEEYEILVSEDAAVEDL